MPNLIKIFNFCDITLLEIRERNKYLKYFYYY